MSFLLKAVALRALRALRRRVTWGSAGRDVARDLQRHGEACHVLEACVRCLMPHGMGQAQLRRLFHVCGPRPGHKPQRAEEPLGLGRFHPSGGSRSRGKAPLRVLSPGLANLKQPQQERNPQTTLGHTR